MNYTKIDSVAAAEYAVQRNQVVVGSVDVHGNVSLASNPVVHTSSTSARAEARRLANANPNRTFVLMILAGAERVVATPRTVSL